MPKRSTEGHFLFAADHAFQIKGQGTIATGTVLRGKIKVCICVNRYIHMRMFVSMYTYVFLNVQQYNILAFMGSMGTHVVTCMHVYDVTEHALQ